jgi:hypothetical protein
MRRNLPYRVPRSEIVELYLQPSLDLHGVLLSELSSGTTSPFIINDEPFVEKFMALLV